MVTLNCPVRYIKKTKDTTSHFTYKSPVAETQWRSASTPVTVWRRAESQKLEASEVSLLFFVLWKAKHN